MQAEYRAAGFSTLVELLRTRAETAPAARAYTYLADGETPELLAAIEDFQQFLTNVSTPPDRSAAAHPTTARRPRRKTT